MIGILQQRCLLLAWLILLAGCSLHGGIWPPDGEPQVTPGLSSPQTVGAVVPWQVSMRGETGDWNYEFIIADGVNEIVAQKGKSTEWLWTPVSSGRYRVKVVVEDMDGRRFEGNWSPEYEIMPALRLVGISPDTPSPQQAGLGTITWHVMGRGGVPPLEYEFVIQQAVRGGAYAASGQETDEPVYGQMRRNGGPELVQQKGESSRWQWHPLEQGRYQITARVRDAAGNTAEAAQPVDYEILAPLSPESLIGVLPVQNMSGAKAPLKKIRKRLEETLRNKGMRLVDEQVMNDFVVRHRLRHTAGLTPQLALALQEETGAQAVLLSSLELYREQTIPKISLTAWLDACGERPRILWMDSKSLSGDENPGLLDLGMIKDMEGLLDTVLVALFESWEPTLLPPASAEAGEERQLYWQQRRADVGDDKFFPREYYRSESLAANRHYTVAVMPFYNLSERKYAGELMDLHFVRLLRQLPNFSVIDPGELRDNLLQYRIIMDDGLSLANAELLFVKLGVDLVVTGKIFDYEDYGGMVGRPIVDFSVEIFSRDGNKTLWTSKSHTDGEKGVFFFDFGKVYTAHNLAGQMVGAIARKLGQ